MKKCHLRVFTRTTHRPLHQVFKKVGEKLAGEDQQQPRFLEIGKWAMLGDILLGGNRKQEVANEKGRSGRKVVGIEYPIGNQDDII